MSTTTRCPRLGVMLLVGAAWCLANHAAALDWPRWRGADANTVAPEGDYPVDLSQSNLAWSVTLPGQGSSSPIVLRDAIYVTCEIDGQDGLCRFDLDGQLLWKRKLGPRREARHRSATGANPSPATDGERVFVYFKSGRLAAVSPDGDTIWRRNLQDDFGRDTLWWDLGSSPIVTETGVVVSVIQEGTAYLVTFDRSTGEVIWKVDRQFDRPEESDQAYTTPELVATDQGELLIVYGADHLTAHDPATGAQRFVSAGFNPDNQPMWRVIASPTIQGEIAVTPYGRGDYLAAVRLTGEGDITDSARMWTVEGVGADVPCPIIHDGLVYQLGDRGELHCLDLATGAVRWSDRLARTRLRYYSTPLLAGGVLYCLREDGVGSIVRVDEQGAEVLGTFDLEDDTVVSPVPLEGGRLLIRSRHKLMLFGES